jgi:hypothetical protein
LALRARVGQQGLVGREQGQQAAPLDEVPEVVRVKRGARNQVQVYGPRGRRGRALRAQAGQEVLVGICGSASYL